MRRTPIVRRTPLTSRSPLARTPMKPRPKVMRRTAAKAREKATKARRDTGPSPSQRRLVFDRAFGCCEICGRVIVPFAGHSYHHRQPRRMGGSSRPEINSPANLLLLCGTATSPGGCHAFVESNRTRAYANGWLVRASADPTEVPVLLEGGDQCLLTDDGGRVEVGDTP